MRNMLVPSSYFLQHFASPIPGSIAMMNVKTQHFAVTHVSKLYKTQQNSQGGSRNHCKSYTMRSVKKACAPRLIFLIHFAHWRSQLFGRNAYKKQYIEDVVSSACRDVVCFSNHRPLAFTGFGPLDCKNIIHCRRHFKCMSGCDMFFQSLRAGVHWLWPA